MPDGTFVKQFLELHRIDNGYDQWDYFEKANANANRNLRKYELRQEVEGFIDNGGSSDPLIIKAKFLLASLRARYFVSTCPEEWSYASFVQVNGLQLDSAYADWNLFLSLMHRYLKSEAEYTAYFRCISNVPSCQANASFNSQSRARVSSTPQYLHSELTRSLEKETQEPFE